MHTSSTGAGGGLRGKMEALAGVALSGDRRDYVVLMDGDLVVNLPLSDIMTSTSSPARTSP
ncbi:MAG: hypothetical protein ACLTYN_06270 [Dysosmobacter welbionis]